MNPTMPTNTLFSLCDGPLAGPALRVLLAARAQAAACSEGHEDDSPTAHTAWQAQCAAIDAFEVAATPELGARGMEDTLFALLDLANTAEGYTD